METTAESPHDLQKLVQDRIAALGKDAPAYFGVPAGLISQWKSGKKPVSLAAAEKVYAEMLADVSKAVMPQIVAEPDNPYGVGSGESVVILSPAYDGIEQKMMTTLFKCIKGYGWEKVSIIPGKERTLIEEERNDLVAKYRRIPKKPEWVVMVDADHVLPCGNSAMLRALGVNYPEHKAARNALVRIMSHPKDKLIVGALYKNRRGTFKPACEIAYRSAQEDARLRALFDPNNKSTQFDGLEKSGWVGLGMTRIHCSVFDRMEEASKNGGPLSEIAPPPGRESDPTGFFGRNSKFRGEDIFFCRRAGEIGIETFVDCGLTIGHIFKGVV